MTLDLSSYRNVVVVTGAGISAGSGIATYRSAGSGWDNPRLERISTGAQAGNHLPELWGFWGPLRAQTAAAAPNAAHRALAAAEANVVAAGGTFLVVTQNVDGLHVRAGSANVVEMHGTLHRSRCKSRSCGTVIDDARVPAPGEVPGCPTCGRGMRPDVVLFGERLPSTVKKLVLPALGRADLCLYVGTSGNVAPASELVEVTKRAGGRCVLVNAEAWVSGGAVFDDVVLGPAEDMLPDLFRVR